MRTGRPRNRNCITPRIEAAGASRAEEAVVNDVRVSSWSELHERLYEGSWKEELGRFRSSFAYRGVADAAHNLTTSLMRLGGSYAEHEGHLLRNFRKYAHRNAVHEDSVWNW